MEAEEVDLGEENNSSIEDYYLNMRFSAQITRNWGIYLKSQLLDDMASVFKYPPPMMMIMPRNNNNNQ